MNHQRAVDKCQEDARYHLRHGPEWGPQGVRRARLLELHDRWTPGGGGLTDTERGELRVLVEEHTVLVRLASGMRRPVVPVWPWKVEGK